MRAILISLFSLITAMSSLTESCSSIQILKSCFENAIQRAVTKVFGKEFSLHVNVTPTSMILRIDRGL